MAEGDYAVEPPAAASGEMGRMAAAVAVFRENGIARRSVEAAQADDRARAEVERRRTLDGIAGQAEAEVGTIAH
jgi:methyl-accepting chemotaxis protein